MFELVGAGLVGWRLDGLWGCLHMWVGELARG